MLSVLPAPVALQALLVLRAAPVRQAVMIIRVPVARAPAKALMAVCLDRPAEITTVAAPATGAAIQIIILILAVVAAMRLPAMAREHQVLNDQP